MLGMAKLQRSTFVVSLDYGVNLQPSFIEVAASNGSSTSPTVYSDVVNGIGPFTYLWTITGTEITINTPTEANTSFNAGGFNLSRDEVVTLTVTDTGAGNAETTRDISVLFEFF